MKWGAFVRSQFDNATKDLIADQPFGGDGIQGGVIFRIPEDGLLAAAAMMEQEHAFG
jgi:hypothetical protein